VWRLIDFDWLRGAVLRRHTRQQLLSSRLCLPRRRIGPDFFLVASRLMPLDVLPHRFQRPRRFRVRRISFSPSCLAVSFCRTAKSFAVARICSVLFIFSSVVVGIARPINRKSMYLAVEFTNSGTKISSILLVYHARLYIL
jgi:hypothetical protein